MALNDKSKTITYILLGLLVIGAAIIIYLVMKNKKKDAERKKQLEAEMKRLMSGQPRYHQNHEQGQSSPVPVQKTEQPAEANMKVVDNESDYEGSNTNSKISESKPMSEMPVPEAELETVQISEPISKEVELESTKEALDTIDNEDVSDEKESTEQEIEHSKQDDNQELESKEIDSSDSKVHEERQPDDSSEDTIEEAQVISEDAANDELPEKWAAFILGIDGKMWIEFHESLQDDDSIRELLQKRGEKTVASFVVEKPENEYHQSVINEVVQSYVNKHHEENSIDPDLVIIEQDGEGKIIKIYGKTQGEEGSRYDVDFDKLFGVEPKQSSDDSNKDEVSSENANQENESLTSESIQEDVNLEKSDESSSDSNDAESDDKEEDDESSSSDESKESDSGESKKDEKTKEDDSNELKEGDKVYAKGGRQIKVYAEPKITDNVILDATPPQDARLHIGKVLDFVTNDEGQWIEIKLKRTNKEALNKGFIRKEDLIMN